MHIASLKNPQGSLLWKSYCRWPLSPGQHLPQGTLRKASATSSSAAFTKTAFFLILELIHARCTNLGKTKKYKEESKRHL